MEYANKTIKIIVLSFLISILICFFNFDFKRNEFETGYWIYNQLLYNVNQKKTILYFVFGILFSFAYGKVAKQTTEITIKLYIIIFSSCMSFVIYLGKSYYLLSSWALMFSSIYNLLFSVTVIALGGICIFQQNSAVLPTI
ncbi:hypothetical protein [Megasphaera sueciensis]|uniref:hypothetical protein n=1 Tax=Megasphaera sueciensis TaxID=349094 RepID=UPI003D086581